MQYVPMETELVQLQSMSAQERLHYATTRMIECEEVWSLGDDNGWIIRDEDGKQVISVWPYHLLAQENRPGEDETSLPQATSLEYFVYGVLDMCQVEDICLEVFPKTDESGHLISSTDLYELLTGLMESGEYLMEG